MDKVKGSVEKHKEKTNADSKLRKAQDQFTLAKSNYDQTLMDEREKLYLGTSEVDSDINKRRT